MCGEIAEAGATCLMGRTPRAGGFRYYLSFRKLYGTAKDTDGNLHYALRVHTDHMPDGTEEEVMNPTIHCPTVVQVL